MSVEMSNIKRPVLRYHGGKWMLAPWIISHFPRHRIYVELFGGAGSVLMRKDRCYAEIYNDKWDTVVNVFQVLRDPELSKKLEEALRLTPFSRTEFNKVGDVNIEEITDPVEKARKTIFRSFAGFGSAATNAKYATGFRANSHRSGTTPAHDWKNFPDNITAFTERLKGVVIENKDYRQVIKQHDSENTLVYADPPYLHSTRNMKRGNASYAHEFTDADHVELCKELKTVTGGVIVSGYENDIYNSLLSDWHKEYREALADGARKRTEVLWINLKAVMMKIL
jgi:DNA adenine methylase